MPTTNKSVVPRQDLCNGFHRLLKFLTELVTLQISVKINILYIILIYVIKAMKCQYGYYQINIVSLQIVLWNIFIYRCSATFEVVDGSILCDICNWICMNNQSAVINERYNGYSVT